MTQVGLSGVGTVTDVSPTTGVRVITIKFDKAAQGDSVILDDYTTIRTIIGTVGTGVAETFIMESGTANGLQLASTATGSVHAIAWVEK